MKLTLTTYTLPTDPPCKLVGIVLTDDNGGEWRECMSPIEAEAFARGVDAGRLQRTRLDVVREHVDGFPDETPKKDPGPRWD